jgi:hypothetical protein
VGSSESKAKGSFGQKEFYSFTATVALFQVRLKETVTTEIGRIS